MDIYEIAGLQAKTNCGSMPFSALIDEARFHLKDCPGAGRQGFGIHASIQAHYMEV